MFVSQAVVFGSDPSLAAGSRPRGSNPFAPSSGSPGELTCGDRVESTSTKIARGTSATQVAREPVRVGVRKSSRNAQTWRAEKLSGFSRFTCGLNITPFATLAWWNARALIGVSTERTFVNHNEVARCPQGPSISVLTHEEAD